MKKTILNFAAVTVIATTAFIACDKKQATDANPIATDSAATAETPLAPIDESVKSLTDSTVSGVKDVAKDAVSDVKDVAKDAVKDTKNAVSDVKEGAKKAVNEVKDAVK